MPHKNISRFLITVSACALLSACQTSQVAHDQADRNSRIDSALERAAMSSAVHGSKKQTLGYLEKIYKRNSNDAVAALNYARALREGDYLRRAELVLAPFANNADSPSGIKSEYAAILLADGNYAAAEDYAQKAISQNSDNYQAYHHLGIALDAQGYHEDAELAFRRGLDHWQGDPTSIMNNLALNLASQGFLDEASEILQKAQAVAPHKLEIERNLRIVTALQQSNGRRAPKPNKKPKNIVLPEKEVAVIVAEPPKEADIEPAASEETTEAEAGAAESKERPPNDSFINN